MSAESREGGAPGVVVFVHCEKGRLVSYVGYVLVVEVVEAANIGCGATEGANEGRLIVRNKTVKILLARGLHT